MNKYCIKKCLIFQSEQTNLIKVERIWLCKYQNGPHQTPSELRKFYVSKKNEENKFNQIYHNDIFYTLLKITSKRYDYI